MERTDGFVALVLYMLPPALALLGGLMGRKRAATSSARGWFGHGHATLGAV